MEALVLATSLVVILGASCKGTVTDEDPPPSGTAAASNAADAPSSRAANPAGPALADTSWVLTIMDGVDWPIGSDRRVTLVFDRTRLTWSAGCNSFNAKWKIVDGHLELGRAGTIVSTLGSA
jgi:heat shock protein HslJ